MSPVDREDSMYFLMVSTSGADKEYRRPLGGEVLGNKLIAQS